MDNYKEQITHEEMMEFALAVREEEAFNVWLDKNDNRKILRFHIMKLVEEVGNVGMKMGAQTAMIELAKTGLMGDIIKDSVDVTDAEDIPPMPDGPPNGTPTLRGEHG